MAARFVVGLALVALCHSNPVLISGVATRDGRALSIAKGSASGFGGQQATANVHGNQAQATGASGGGLARDGLYYAGPGQALADAQTYDGSEQAAIDLARAQGFYYPHSIPQPIVYNNYVPEQLVYQPIAVAPAAESAATINGASDSSLSTAAGGAAESNAQTSGSYGQTATNAKTFGGYNTAASNANSGLGVASVSSKASGAGYGGFAASNAQTNGISGFAPAPVQVIAEPVVIAAKQQGYYSPSQFGSASSNANVNGYGSAISSARTGPAPARRSISWHFGTAYDIPAGYGSAKSTYQTPVVYQSVPVVYQATPVEVSPYVAKSSANTHGAGSAQSAANLNAGFGSTRSTANSNLGGSANANADLSNNGYNLYRSGAIGSGFAKTSANTNGLGSADSNANLNHGVGIAKSTANSNGGSANANADINNQGYGLYRSAEGSQWGRTVSDARTSGFGNAQSNAQGYPSGLKIADSSANSNGWGSAIANSQSL